jgi:sugar O-acyltransferase (sialic acid O-acetyltransferase NeuD family)
VSKVVIFGCGQGADIAFRYLANDSPHEICGFAVDKAYLDKSRFHDLPVVAYETVEEVFPPNTHKLFIPLGFQKMNRLRAEKYLNARSRGYGFVSYVNSSIFRVTPIVVGENCFILENQSINLDVRIGNNVVIWSGNQIGDRSVIEDHVWITSQVAIAGDVTIGENSFLGINSTISNNVVLAPGTFVGANALITKNTVRNAVYLVEGSKALPMDSEKFMSIVDSTLR